MFFVSSGVRQFGYVPSRCLNLREMTPLLLSMLGTHREAYGDDDFSTLN